MKAIKILNLLAVALPLFLLLLGFTDEEFLIYSMVSAIFTGALQIILAFVLFFNDLKNIYLMVYFGICISFFIYFFGTNDFGLDSVFSIHFWIVPIVLASYLTIIISLKKNLTPTEFTKIKQ